MASSWKHYPKTGNITGIVTVDGPAGSGKSTVSRLLAGKIGYSYLDTGATYRAVALAASRRGVDPLDTSGLKTLCGSLDLAFDRDQDPPAVLLDGEDVSDLIRTPGMDMLSSRVSAVSEVRRAMIALQRRIARGGGFVAEGRDMGTVVFPEADFKFFLTASAGTRAERRYRELMLRGESVDRQVVEMELKQRDDQDSLRARSPLKPAHNATIIDSTTLTVEEVVDLMLRRMDGS